MRIGDVLSYLYDEGEREKRGIFMAEAKPAANELLRHERERRGWSQQIDLSRACTGPEHPDVAITLADYASLLRQTNRTSEAVDRESRVQAIRAKQE
jgi:hypothetical protein